MSLCSLNLLGLPLLLSYCLRISSVVRLHGDSAIMPDVTVVTQSDAILAGPSSSSYRISVINVGRHFALDTVMGLNLGLGEGMKDAEGVGKVIGQLMLIGDVLVIVNPRSVALDAAEVDAAEVDEADGRRRRASQERRGAPNRGVLLSQALPPGAGGRTPGAGAHTRRGRAQPVPAAAEGGRGRASRDRRVLPPGRPEGISGQVLSK